MEKDSNEENNKSWQDAVSMGKVYEKQKRVCLCG